jgi:putative addiction module antidote
MGYNIPMATVKVTTVKVTTVGNSAGIILPKELLEKLRVSKGDTLHVTETSRGLEISPYDDEFAEGMRIAEEVMREDRDILKKLSE